MPNRPFHAKFKLSSVGETVYLYDPNAYLIDSCRYPIMAANESWALTGNGFENVTWFSPGFENTPEGIAKMKETLDRLRKRCMELKEEILHIRSSYPYTMKAFLEDEKAVEARQEELHSEIDRTREMDRQLEEYIDQLKKQMGYV